MRVLNSAQMRQADRRTIDEIGVPALVLMENAGREVAAAIEAAHPEWLEGRVTVLSGRGNNGGDGFVVARTLRERGVDVGVVLIGRAAEVRGDARTNLDILGRLGIAVLEIPDGQTWELHGSEIGRAALIVDAIFGTGLSAPLSGLLETIVADVNESGVPVVSIDLPSGLSADCAEPIGCSIRANMTVTLAAPKLPLVLAAADNRAGDVIVADIGIPRDVINDIDGRRLEVLTGSWARGCIQPRSRDSHKGDYGHVLVVGGSRGKTGAAHLAALGALKSGAGLVTVATPAGCQDVVASLAPEYMTEGIREADGGLDPNDVDRLLDTAAWDVAAIGPGLGRSPSTMEFVRRFLERASVPVVIDADGLFAVGDDPQVLSGHGGRVIVVTPHPGEMGRLVGRSADEVQMDRLEVAESFAATRRVYVVLKGHRTLVATPDRRVFINPTGNPGLATGGTGDVLTGAISAWLAQGREADVACSLGVYLHGIAGDLAKADESEVAMTAGDVAARLGSALRQVTAVTTRLRQGDRPHEHRARLTSL
jgi:NAD(P)H-hydrate epimerase